MIQHVLLARPQKIDHRETFSYLWALTGEETSAKKDYEGQSLVVANFSNRSIQTDHPLLLLGSCDEVQWYPILQIKEPGIYPIQLSVRAVKPIGQKNVKTRVVVFINAA